MLSVLKLFSIMMISTSPFYTSALRVRSDNDSTELTTSYQSQNFGSMFLNQKQMWDWVEHIIEGEVKSFDDFQKILDPLLKKFVNDKKIHGETGVGVFLEECDKNGVSKRDAMLVHQALGGYVKQGLITPELEAIIADKMKNAVRPGDWEPTALKGRWDEDMKKLHSIVKDIKAQSMQKVRSGGRGLLPTTYTLGLEVGNGDLVMNLKVVTENIRNDEERMKEFEALVGAKFSKAMKTEGFDVPRFLLSHDIKEREGFSGRERILYFKLDITLEIDEMRKRLRKARIDDFDAVEALPH